MMGAAEHIFSSNIFQKEKAAPLRHPGAARQRWTPDQHRPSWKKKNHLWKRGHSRPGESPLHTQILFRLLFSAMLLAPLSAFADAPEDSLGLPSMERDGAFLDLSIGIETAVGGLDPESGKNMPSSPSLFLKVGGGYAVLDWLEIGASFSLGAVGNRCMGAASDKGTCIESTDDWSSVSGDFTLASLMADAAWRYALMPGLALKVTVSAGWVFMDPEPRAGLSGGFSAGLGAGILWRTPLDHFSIGISAAWYFVPQASLHEISLTPQIRYTF